MALSLSEKHDVVRLLGYPGKVIIEDSLQYSHVVASRLESLNSEIESDVKALLARVSKLDGKLSEALDRASVTKIDDIDLNPEEMNLLRAERRRVVRELSELLDIPVVAKTGVMIPVCV